MVESEEELKSLLMKVKEESLKSWLKTEHSKNEIILYIFISVQFSRSVVFNSRPHGLQHAGYKLNKQDDNK